MRTLSKARVIGPVTDAIALDDLDIIAQGCAQRTATKAWTEERLKMQLQQVFAHDAAFVEKHRGDPLPAPQCPDPGR
ncbi:hypothetical protein thalar_00827 [Litoreibacter arenae DSM 19593]|uniref:Uncharacterized protein n=1 Tax=Litoreibacter arenae DSM 19593 TaxID=1123360 RepID=S9QLK5_9RHOB|nr:hypothetical protein thalar_00827 [Litoreibacter arenae DSM 19593]